jgi:hypothetical protein
MNTDRRALLALACCLLLAFAGCAGGGIGGAGGGDGGAAQADDGGAAPTGESATQAADASDGAGTAPTAGATVEDRALIRTGEATIEVESFENARTGAIAAARERGGYVSATEQRVHSSGNRSWTTGTLTLRVPNGNFSGFLTEVRGLGQVESVSTETRDVTDQLVDLNARIGNLRGQRAQLRELYNRTNSTEELLEIQERLSEVQTEIERLSAQRESLRNRVAYSTLTLHIEERPPNRIVETENWYDTPLLGAFLQSIDGVVVTLRALAVGAAYAAPYVVAFGVPIAGAAWWARRRDRRGTGGPGNGGDGPADGGNANAEGDAGGRETDGEPDAGANAEAEPPETGGSERGEGPEDGGDVGDEADGRDETDGN